MNLTLITGVIAIAIGASTGFGAAWTWQGRTIDKMKLEAANERITIQRAARAALERTLSTQQAAANAATRRATDLRVAADRARAESDGLRNSIATIVRATASNPATCPDRAATLGGLLDTMEQAGRELAGKADRHASDIKLMQDSWPK